ncbi:MAG TPA: hypothetical protein VG734_05380 [Lacunisphaera sp.]|nr:hypothetical protein [Lacunisphaera sp.]
MFSPHRSSRLSAAVLGGLFILPVRPLPACGPDFPNAYLALSAQDLAGLPTLNFAAELGRVFPTDRPQSSYTAGENHDAELGEIREVLAARLPRRRVDLLLAKYNRIEPPPELPAEFHLYAAGARAWHGERAGEAVAAWRQLLALPANERRYRTVWAHYMIGRALWDTDEPAARAAFQAARAAAAAGFSDSEGLAAASFGWEARTHLGTGEMAAALQLYFQQHLAGDPGAASSLQMVIQKVFADDAKPGDEPALKAIAADRQLRAIVTAWFTSRGGPNRTWSGQATKQFRRWLSALPKDANLEPTEADRWAWAAYQNGLWSDADAFAAVAPAEAPASEWVRAMLRLREGDLVAAVGHLSGAAQGFPRDAALQSPLFRSNDWHFQAAHEDPPQARLDGVRGVLALRRAQYTEALRLFVAADHWADAAYVAEHVLTLDELTAFVRHDLPAANGAADAAPHSPAALRALLARRLVRAGRFDDAREYFAEDFRPTFDRYVAFVRDGYREENPRQLRALALWQAAQIAWQSGMELQGTELEPDFAIWDGNFEWPDTSAVRLTGPDQQSRWTWYSRPQEGFLSVVVATEDERRRTADLHLPSRRYHYRHRAAQLAWLASTLLPDNDDLTATILNTAGRWIAPRYPEDAELFYKTLAFRCPRTALGKAAAERHWLVPPGPAPGI